MSSDAGGGGVADEKVGVADEEMGVSDVTGGSDGCKGGGVVPVVLGRAGDVLMDGDASSATCTQHSEVQVLLKLSIYVTPRYPPPPPQAILQFLHLYVFGNTN